MLGDIFNLMGAASGRSSLFMLCGILFIAAAIDLRHRRIPNLLTLLAALLALFLHGILGGVQVLAASFVALIVALLAGFSLYRSAAGCGIGAGDIKLLAACAAFLGLWPMLHLAFFSFAGQVLWMFARWALTSRARRNFGRLLRWAVDSLTPGVPVVHFKPEGAPDATPHAPFMLLGALVVAALWGHDVSL